MQLRNLLKLSCFILFCFFAIPAIAQNKTITGKVTDSKDGSPLIGASVIAQGSTVGTVVDVNGNYRLSVPQTTTTLVVTYTGYVRREVLITGAVTNITLDANTANLNEVLVVGYGTVRKKDATGAVAKVTSDNFVQGVTTDPLQQLQGKAAGVVITTTNGDPNNTATVRIRGTASLSGGNDPLYVIDGVAGADIRSVAPNDIESFDILKDASAAAIYGSRAAGGVILITTKQGKAGKPQVTYNAYVGSESAEHLIKFMNRSQYFAAAAQVGPGVTAGLQTADASRQPNDVGGADNNWFNQILRTGLTTNNNVAVAGGTEVSHYRGSVTYQSQQGIAQTSKRNALFGRFSFDQKALDNKLTITMNLAATHANSTYVDQSAFLYAATFLPIYQVYNPDGSFNDVNSTDVSNPVSHIKEITFNGIDDQMVGNLRFDYLLAKGLTLSAFGNGTKETLNGNLYLPTTSVANAVGDLTGNYSLHSSGLGDDDRNVITNAQVTYDATLGYKNTFGKSRINLLGGYEYNKFSYTGLRVTSHDFTGIDQPYINIGDANTITPGADLSSYDNGYRLTSFFARAEYNFNDKYYFTANLRNDNSTKLGFNNQSGTFPSVNAAWTISNEDFLKGINWLTSLKLRGGYGTVGDQGAITPLGSQSLYGSTGTPYFDLSSGTWRTSNGPIQNPNPNLRWEIKTTKDVAVDFSLFNGRLSGSLDYYSEVTNHLLYTYNVPVGSTFNYPTILANVGQLTNKGVELSLEGIIVAGHQFNWKSGFNMSFNRNKVTNLSGSFAGTSLHTDSVVVGSTSGTGISGAISQIGYIKVGYPIGTLSLPQYAGITSAGLQEFWHYNADGTRTAVTDITQVLQTDRRFYTTDPKFTYGFSNNFSYDKFELSIFMRGQYGSKGFNETYMDYTSLAKVGTYNVLADAAKLGIKSSSEPSTYWLQSTSFLKIQNVSLGYNFIIRDNRYLDKIHVYVAGNNLYTFTSYKGDDPELITTGGQIGIDSRTLYPRSRQLSFGLNVTLK